MSDGIVWYALLFDYWCGEVVRLGSCSVMESGSNCRNNGLDIDIFFVDYSTRGCHSQRASQGALNMKRIMQWISCILFKSKADLLNSV